MPTHGEMIDEISREPPEPFAKERLIDAIVEQQPRALIDRVFGRPKQGPNNKLSEKFGNNKQ